MSEHPIATMMQERMRRRLRRRAFVQMLHGELTPAACERLMLDESACDEVLQRIDAAKDAGDGTLWEFLQKIDWVRLLEIIMAVVSVLGAMEDEDSDEKERPIDQLRQAESD